MSLLPVQDGASLSASENSGKWGYVDRAGSWIINPAYDFANEFSDNGLAIVEIAGKQGFIDKLGQWKIHPIFDRVNEFDEYGRAIASVKLKNGAIDETGNWLIEPSWAIGGSITDEGITTSRKDGKLGFIDISRKWIIPPRFDRTFPFDKWGLAFAKIDGKSGIINTQGEWIIGPEKFYYGPNIHEGKFFSASYQGNKDWKLFDQKGKQITKMSFEARPAYQDGGLFAVKYQGKWGVLNASGEWTINPIFNNIYKSGKNDLWIATKDGNYWGFITNEGQWKVEPTFTSIGLRFKNDLIAARTKERNGFIDKQGEWIFEFPSNILLTEVDDNGFVEFGKNLVFGSLKLGLVSTSGEIVVPVQFFSINYREDGLYSVTFPNFKGKGYLDADRGFRPIGFN